MARLGDFHGVNRAMVTTRRGVPISTCNGRVCMGNPLNVAGWLADAMLKHGRPLEASDVVMTRAMGPMAAVEPGDIVAARIEGLGQVRACFGL